MTKLLFCKKCGELVPMSFTLKQCKCGNVKGKYLSGGSTIAVDIKSLSEARLVGISNMFLQEKNIPFDHPIYDNTMFQERMCPIIIVYPYTTNDVVSLNPEKDVPKQSEEPANNLTYVTTVSSNFEVTDPNYVVVFTEENDDE